MSRILTTLILCGFVSFVLIGCTSTAETEEMPESPTLEQPAPAPTIPDTEEEGPLSMALTSPAFNAGDPIPTKYSCDGEDISPELDWFGTPEGTVSLALIMDDPDAPGGTWVHWVVYNLPMDLSGLREGMTGVGLEGSNSWKQSGYGGPCPPSGTHRYFFKLYALDLVLGLEAGADKAAVLSAMEGHILGEAELMGTYSR